MILRRTVASLCALALAFSSGAQRHAVTFVPERNPQGALFSLEEVAGSRARSVYPDVYRPAPRPAARPAPRHPELVSGSQMLNQVQHDEASPRSVMLPRAVSRDGTLYIDGSPVASATGCVSYGTSVSRNEFGIDGGIFWSPDSNRVAFFRKDESAVRDYALMDIATAGVRNIKYPFNGEDSEVVSLGVYDLKTGDIAYLQTDACYITNITWSPSSRYIYAITGSRSQHDWKLQKFDAVDGVLLKTVLYEHNDAWFEPYQPVHFLPDGRKFIYSSDNRDGYKSLYVCADRGVLYRLNTGRADAEFLGVRGSYVYYLGYSVSPANPQLYRIAIEKKAVPELMTNGRGSHRIYMQDDGYVDVFSSVDDAGWSVRCNLDGRVVDTLKRGGDPLACFASCAVEFGTVKSADGRFDNNYRLILPLGFDPSRKYPLLVYVYGGPHLQMVSDTYMAGYRAWEMYMAQRGYVVYVQDNRGTPNHGLEYEQAINRCLGQVEMQDQMVGIRSLLAEPWIDRDRVAVSGWSYGGFMTISLLTNYPDVFAAGVCGGPVIDWRWYEVMYGERYMDNPETNPEGFEAISLMNRVDSLRAPLLICQGMLDYTVLPYNSMNFVQECVRKGVCVNYMPYPMSEHNVAGPWRMQLYKTFTEFLDKHVKNNR